MVLNAVYASASGLTGHIYSQDKNVLLLALRRDHLLGMHTTLIMGVGPKCRTVMLQPIFV